jgi:hypothetical protein
MHYTSPFQNIGLDADDTFHTSQHLYYHRSIADDAVLLYFLQDENWDAKKPFKTNPIYTNIDFINFISPYFTETYQNLLLQALTEESPEQLNDILQIKPRLMTKEDTANTWHTVESYLDEWKETVKAAVKTEIMDDGTMQSCYQPSKVACLNLLPPQFSWFRDEYAMELNALSAHIWNKGNQTEGALILKNAQSLTVSEETKRAIQTHEHWFQTRLQTHSTTKATWDISKILFYTVLMVLLYIFFFVEVKMTLFDMPK